MYIDGIYILWYNSDKGVDFMGAKYTESQKNAIYKHLAEKTDRMDIRMPKGKKEEYKALAEKRGKSLNGLILELLENELKKED